MSRRSSAGLLVRERGRVHTYALTWHPGSRRHSAVVPREPRTEATPRKGRRDA
jgi:hypothetical protein